MTRINELNARFSQIEQELSEANTSYTTAIRLHKEMNEIENEAKLLLQDNPFLILELSK